MRVFAISDLHLSSVVNKPMNIFGGRWQNYWQKIKADWQAKVLADDLVLISGDISWAMRPEDAIPDLEDIATLPGKKVIIRGNHDYWWQSYAKVKSFLPEGVFAIQNDAKRFENVIVAGTRGWTIAEKNSLEADQKIFEREKIRLALTLDAAKKLKTADEKIYVMMHYPPFDVHTNDSDFTDIIKEFPVTAVVYGHLHGKDCKANFVTQKDGINYYLTSCDLLGHRLLQLDNQ